MRTFVFAALLFASTANAATISASYLTQLPPGTAAHAIGVDPAGFVYAAGDRSSGSNTTAFVAKLSANGSSLVWYQETGGSRSSTAAALTVGSDGAVYVTGTTASTDFPTTDGSMFGLGTAVAFVWKLAPDGSTAYSVLLGGDSNTAGMGIAVNQDGGAFVTGQATQVNFPFTPGGIQSKSPSTWFVVRLDNSGSSALYAVTGPGGSHIAIDAQNNAYISGTTIDPTQIPITSGVYQATVAPATAHQYVCKINSTGTQIFFCTFVSGANGSFNSGLAVDSQGNVDLTGVTASTDYPVTSAALNMTAPGTSTGFYTQLSADGTRLLYSTYIGGTSGDSITGLALDQQGNPYLAALIQSPDFPSLPQAPVRCLPQVRRRVPAIVRLSSDGTSIASETLVEEAAPCDGCSLALAISPQGKAYLAGAGPWLASLDPSNPPKPDVVACVTDSVDYAHAGPVAPGELLTIFGSGMASTDLLLNGTKTPVLYSSDTQINFVLPPGISGAAVRFDVSQAGKSLASRTLPIVAEAPSLLLAASDAAPSCNGNAPPNGVSVLAVNEDGTLNGCDHLAAPGSAVTVYLNGAGGGTSPIIQNSSSSSINVESVTAVSGLWAVKLRLPSNPGPFVLAGLTVQGVAVREQNAVIWVNSN